MNTEKNFIISKKVDHSANISSLYFSKKENNFGDFIAGQYVTIYIPELGIPEGKSYSISSAPHENEFVITIKKMGLFSNYLCDLSAGDTVSMSDPYGFFYPDEDGRGALVCIAGGIGITPFRSIILDELKKKSKRNIFLYYSSKTKDDLVFFEDFKNIADTYKNVHLFFHITGERIPQNPFFIQGRISPQNILKNYEQEIANSEFLLCGSIGFVKDMWKGLKNNGIPEFNIYTESFY